MYLAPGVGQTTPWGQPIVININFMSFCSFPESFLQLNDVFPLFPIQMHERPKLNMSRSSQGHDLYKLCRAFF